MNSNMVANTSLAFFSLLLVFAPSVGAESDTPRPLTKQEVDTIVRAAVDYWRDESSYTEASMKVHRPDWERTMSMSAWTLGMDQTLVRFTAPAKDAGSASLTKGNDVWSYAPKINRVIKIPPSMKGQSWMGSDFSYRDLSRSDDILEYYEHSLLGTEESEGHKIYKIQSVPKEDAPVVWGKETLRIRDDYIILSHTFYDQDLKPIKRLKTLRIELLGQKLYPVLMRMEKLEEQGEWTEIETTKASFGVPLKERIFTLSNLRNPRTR